MSSVTLTLLRYPGGKQRQLLSFAHILPSDPDSYRSYIEPFVGGASVFFHINPYNSVLSDINPELIELYQGIRDHPDEVWEIYQSVPETKSAYYTIRKLNPSVMDLPYRAARILYLNRTCFKGMWRHNAQGDFNVGYGGQDRRWSITHQDLLEVSDRLQRANLVCSDFETVIDKSKEGDFLFLDPPYRPGAREQIHDHYKFGSFRFKDQKRLAATLFRATERGVNWTMTNSSHPDIIDLYSGCSISPLEIGTGDQIGRITNQSQEVLIQNYMEAA
jgi:DNA adenine methylase